MALTYSRWTPQEVASDVAVHVRAHLSSIAAEDDDPDRYADEVDVVVVADGDGLLVTGTLDRDAVAAYLCDGFDPEDDVAANPLTVQSIVDLS